MTELQKKTAQAIVNIFETGEARGNYGRVTLLPQDPGHLTYGRSQVTLTSGNLHRLIETYCAREDAMFASALRAYLPRLQRQDVALDADRDLHDLLRGAGADPVMQEVQDEFFDAEYWKRALTYSQRLAVTSALGQAIIYDSLIHGSWLLVQNQTLHEQGSPTVLGERPWLKQYVTNRRAWLATHPNELLRRTVYRMDVFLELIAKGKWELPLPLVIRGVRLTEALLGPAPVPLRNRELAPPVKNPTLAKSSATAEKPVADKKSTAARKPSAGTLTPIAKLKAAEDAKPNGTPAPVGKPSAAKLSNDKLPAAPTTTVKKAHKKSKANSVRLLQLQQPYLEGDDVRRLQEALVNAGMKVQVSGRFGPTTQKVLRNFQRSRGLKDDGIVTSATRAALGL
jgi:chitosanase